MPSFFIYLYIYAWSSHCSSSHLLFTPLNARPTLAACMHAVLARLTCSTHAQLQHIMHAVLALCKLDILCSRCLDIPRDEHDGKSRNVSAIKIHPSKQLISGWLGVIAAPTDLTLSFLPSLLSPSILPAAC